MTLAPVIFAAAEFFFIIMADPIFWITEGGADLGVCAVERDIVMVKGLVC